MASYDPKEQSAEILKLKGRKLLLDGKPSSNVDAIRALKSAHDMFEKGRVFDEETTLSMAEAFFALHEFGQARLYAAEVVSHRPREVAARKLLANVSLMDGQPDQAKLQLDALEKQGVKDADVIRMRIETLKGSENKEAIAELLKQLPEASGSQQFSKARAALRAGDKDMAIGLLKQLQAQQDFVVRATRLLAQIYLGDKDEAKAIDAVEHGLEVKKNDKLLLMTLGILKKQSPEEKLKLAAGILDEIPDEAERELRLYDLERRNNHPEEALKHLEAAKRIKPEDGQVVRTVFEYDLSQKNYDDALKCIEKLSALNWDHMGGLRFKYQYALARDRLPEALTAAQGMTSSLPDFAYTWLMLGDVQQAMGQYEPASLSYGKALEREGNSAVALRGLINCNYQMNQPETARQYIARANTIFPDSAEFKDMALRHQESFDDPEKVTDARRKQLKDNDASLDNWIALARNYFMAGAKHSAKNDESGAASLYALARATLNEAKSKGDWGDQEVIYRLLEEIGLRTNKPEDSIAALQEFAARPKWKDSPRPNLLLAERYKSMGKLDEAEKELKTALSKSNNDQKVQLELARFYEDTSGNVKGQAEKAIALLDQLFASSQNIDVLKKSIDLQIRSNHLDEAEKMINEQLAKHADDADLITLQGLLFLARQDPAKAEDRFNAALKLDSSNPRARFSLGVVYLATHKVNQAVDQLELAGKMSAAADVHSALAEAYAQKGDVERAITELEGLLRQNALNGSVRIRLLQLYAAAGNLSRMEQLLDDAEKNSKLSKDAIWFKIHAQRLMTSNPIVALDKIQRAVQLAPNDLDTLYLYVELLLRNKAFDKATGVVNQLAQSKSLENDWRLHMYEGSVLYQAQKKDEAFNEFDTALSLTADNDAAHAMTVQRLIEAAGMSDAIARAAEKAKDDVRWRILLATLYRNDGQWDKAVKTIDGIMEPAELAKLSPDRKEQAYRAAGAIYIARGAEDRTLYDKAITVYTSYLAQLTDMGDKANVNARFWVLNNLAYLISDIQKQPEKALKYSTMAMDLIHQTNQKHPEILDTHGWILVQCKKIDEGITVLNQALSGAPISPTPPSTWARPCC